MDDVSTGALEGPGNAGREVGSMHCGEQDMAGGGPSTAAAVQALSSGRPQPLGHCFFPLCSCIIKRSNVHFLLFTYMGVYIHVIWVTRSDGAEARAAEESGEHQCHWAEPQLCPLQPVSICSLAGDLSSG
jgi:hypothetical protein